MKSGKMLIQPFIVWIVRMQFAKKIGLASIMKHTVVACVMLLLPSQVGAWSSQMTQLTFSLNGEYQPEVGSGGYPLVYVSDEGGFLALNVLDKAMNEPRMLQAVLSDETWPRLDSRGKWLYLDTRKRDAQGDIQRIRLDGNRGQIIIGTERAERHPVPSPDGKLLVYEVHRGSHSDLFLTPIHGLKRIERSIRITEKGGKEPDWSPQGDKIVYSRGTTDGDKLFVFDRLSGRHEQLTWGKSIDFGPAFSPDGAKVVFSRILFDTDGDGQLSRNDHSFLAVVNLQTLRVDRLTDGRHRDYSPRWKGDWIYFSSDRSGNFDIWKVKKEGQLPAFTDEESLRRFISTQGDPYFRALALERFVAQFPGSRHYSSMALALGTFYAAHGWMEGAFAQFRRAAQHSTDAYIRLNAMAQYLKLLARKGFPLGTLEQSILSLSEHDGAFKGGCFLAIAELYGENRAYKRALEYLEEIESDEGISQALRQRAQLLKATYLIQLYGTSEKTIDYLTQKSEDPTIPLGLRRRLVQMLITLKKGGRAGGRDKAEWKGEPRPEGEKALLNTYLSLDYATMLLGERKWAQAAKLFKPLLDNALLSDSERLQVGKRYLECLSRNGSLSTLLSSDTQRLIQMRLKEEGLTLLNRERFKAARRYARDGDFETASKVLAHLLEAQPENVGWHRFNIRLLNQLGKLPERASYLQRYSLSQCTVDYLTAYLATFQPLVKGKVKARLLPIISSLEELVQRQPYHYYAYQTMGWCYERIGRDYQLRGKDGAAWFSDAINSYNLALQILPTEQVESLRQLNLNLGNVYYWLKKFRRATAFFERWVSLRPGGERFSFRDAVTLFRCARSLYYAGHSHKAATYFEEVIPYFEAHKHPQWHYLAILEAGLAYYDEGAYRKANEQFLKALSLLGEGGSDSRRRVLERNVAINYYHLGDMTAALEHFTRVVAGLESAEYRSWSRERLQSYQGFDFESELKLAYSFMAEIYRNRGNVDRARSMLNKKLRLFRKTGSEDWRSRIYNAMGELSYLAGDYNGAIESFKKSAALCKRIEQTAGLRRNYYNLGVLALARLRQGRGSNIALTENNIEEIVRLVRRGSEMCTNIRERNRFFLLLARLQRYLEIRVSSVSGDQRRDTEKAAASDFAELMWAEKAESVSLIQPRRALAESLRIAESLSLLRVIINTISLSQDYGQMIDAQLELSAWFSALGAAKEAQEYAVVAKEAAEKHHFPLKLCRSLKRLAILQLGEHHRSKAQLLLREAINIWESLLSGERYGREELTMSNSPLQLYDLMIEQLLAEDDGAGAFFYNERKLACYSILLFQSIGNLRNTHPAYKLYNEYMNIRQRVQELSKDRAGIEGLSEEQFVQARIEAVTKLRRVMKRIEEQAPTIAPYLWVKAWQHQEVQGLLNDDEAILSIAVLPTQCVLWVIRNNDFQWRVVPKGALQLAEDISRLNKKVTSGEEAGREAAVLAQSLLWPINDKLRGIRYLTIVENGLSDAVPYAMLPLEEGDKPATLLDRFRLTFLPSVSHLGVLFEKENFNRRTLLGYGSNRLDAQGLQTLNAIGEAFPVFTLRDNLRCRLSTLIDLESKNDFDVIHLALPFTFTQSSPPKSYLTLEAGDTLSCTELASLPLNANIVVLGGAGENRRHKMVNSQRLESSTRLVSDAFLCAGAASVLLPAIERMPAHTQKLLSRFYSLYANKASKSDALNGAMKTLRKEKVPARDWAFFRLYGHRGFNPSEKKNYLLRKAKFLKKKSRIARSTGNFQQYLRLLNELIEVYKEFSKTEKTIFSIYNEIIKVSYQIGDFNGALHACNKALKLLNAWKPAKFEGYRDAMRKRRSVVKYKAGFIDEAIKEQTAILASLTNPLKKVQAALELSRYYFEAGDAPQALKVVKSIDESLLSHLPKASKAEYFYLMGKYLRHNDEYEESTAPLKKALALANSQEGSRTIRLAIMTLQELVIATQKMGKYEEVAPLVQRMLQLSQAQGDSDLQFTSQVIAAQYLWRRGDYAACLQRLTVATRLMKESDDHGLAVFDYHNTFGLLLWKLGDFTAARKHFIRNLEYLKSMGAEKRRASLRATTFNQLGLIELSQKRYTQAEENFTKALRIDETSGSATAMAYDYKNLGFTALSAKNYNKAITALRKAVGLAESTDDSALRSDIKLGMLQTWYEQGALTEAESLLSELAHSGMLKIPESSIIFHWLAGKIKRRLNKIAEAKEYFSSAIRILQTYLRNSPGEKISPQRSESLRELFDSQAELLIEAKQFADAFDILEMKRLFTFNQLLSNIDIPSGGGIPKALINKERSMRVTRRTFQMSPEANPSSRSFPRSNSLAWNRDSSTVQSSLKTTPQEKRSHKEYASLLNSISQYNKVITKIRSMNGTTLKEVQRLQAHKSLFINYFIGARGAWVWLVDADSIRVIPLKVELSAVRKAISQWNRDIKARKVSSPAAHSLYRWLITPIEAYLQGHPLLFLVADGAVRNLAFETLSDRGHFLGERHTFCYLAATSFLTAEKAAVLVSPIPKTSHVLGMANPRTNSQFSALPASEEELKALVRLFPNSFTLVRKQSTVENLKAELPVTSVLHIAAHIQLNNDSPLLSRIMLATAVNQGDGAVSCLEVMKLAMRAKLVYLSACSAAALPQNHAGAPMSPVQAFLLDSVPLVIGPAWSVDDVSAARLSREFYANAIEEPLWQAIQHTRKEIMVHQRAPYYWASAIMW